MANNFIDIIPILPIHDLAATLSYYRDVLGYSIRGQHEDAFGSVLRGKANFYFSKTEKPIEPVYCCVYVEEVDELCRSFEAKGATILEQPEDKPWGHRQFTLEDINGHRFYYFRFSDGVE